MVPEGAGEGGPGGVEKLRDLRKRHADSAVEGDGRAALEVLLAVNAVVGPRARGCDEAERLCRSAFVEMPRASAASPIVYSIPSAMVAIEQLAAGASASWER